MRKRNSVMGVVSAALVMSAAQATRAGEAAIQAVQVASGLNKPLFVTAPPGDFDRVFIVEQRGRVRILSHGEVLRSPFLDIDSIVGGGLSNVDERGLLGLAFDPDFANNGFFYVNYTNNFSDTVIARYHVSADSNIADRNSAVTLLTVEQPFPNHKGGWLAFGPDDGYLYIALGDGGEANDPGNRAQDITNQLLGKILRIDVRGDDFPDDDAKNYAIPATNPLVGVEGDDEIWAYGLRNPWRCSFDRALGHLYIADVGQDDLEEINVQPATSLGGENYGWRCMEADACTGLSGCSCGAASLTLPVHFYPHKDGCSITGGYVYRGCAIPSSYGTYFFADYCSDRIWSFKYDGLTVLGFEDRTLELRPAAGRLDWISSFGEDAYGELYFCNLLDGQVFKIVPAASGPDCNLNSVADPCDIADGTSPDVDVDGVPDECEVVRSIVASVPPTGAIDARQPSALDGSSPTGWQSLELTFDGPAFNVFSDQFTVTQEGGAGAPPVVTAVVPIDSQRLTVQFSARIAPCAWTTLTHNPSGTAVQLGFLPADANGDGISSPQDILALIDALNNAIPRPIWSTDINHSAMTEAGDILRLIDILNGAGAFADVSPAQCTLQP